jgi:hypothetical protein
MAVTFIRHCFMPTTQDTATKDHTSHPNNALTVQRIAMYKCFTSRVHQLGKPHRVSRRYFNGWTCSVWLRLWSSFPDVTQGYNCLFVLRGSRSIVDLHDSSPSACNAHPNFASCGGRKATAAERHLPLVLGTRVGGMRMVEDHNSPYYHAVTMSAAGITTGMACSSVSHALPVV